MALFENVNSLERHASMAQAMTRGHNNSRNSIIPFQHFSHYRLIPLSNLKIHKVNGGVLSAP